MLFLPLQKMWVRQLGWYDIPKSYGKMPIHGNQTTNQIVFMGVMNHGFSQPTVNLYLGDKAPSCAVDRKKDWLGPEARDPRDPRNPRNLLHEL